MTDTEKVRLLISDKVAPYHFTDGEILAFLDMAEGSVSLAVAMALEARAASLSESAESERIGDYSYTKRQVSNLLDLAKRYRENVALEPLLQIASMNLTDVA